MYQLAQAATSESQIGNLVVAFVHVTMTDLHPRPVSGRERGSYKVVDIQVVTDLFTIEDHTMVSIAIWSRGE